MKALIEAGVGMQYQRTSSVANKDFGQSSLPLIGKQCVSSPLVGHFSTQTELLYQSPREAFPVSKTEIFGC